jgi:glycosyltransferase involved in cell wall biosynthesis
MCDSTTDYGLLSVVVPLFNEAKNVQPLVNAIERALNQFEYELILVDDGSTDDTFEQLKLLTHSHCVVLRLKYNHGQSMALALGIDEAKGNYIATIDGDLQNDPADIPKLIDKAHNEQWDIVSGIRTKRQDSFWKTIPSNLANTLIRKLTKIDIKDHGCALKVITKKTAKNLPLHKGMHRFICLLAILNDARVTQVAIRHNARQSGMSKYGLERTFKVINDIFTLLIWQKFKQNSYSCIGLLLLRNQRRSVQIPHYTRYKTNTKAFSNKG